MQTETESEEEEDKSLDQDYQTTEKGSGVTVTRTSSSTNRKAANVKIDTKRKPPKKVAYLRKAVKPLPMFETPQMPMMQVQIPIDF